MTLYSGRCITSASSAVTGRLWHAEKQDLGNDSARILLWDGVCELNEGLIRTAVGVICPPDVERERLSAVKRAAEVCHVPAIELERALSESCTPDKIAIIDTSQQRVYVDPDIETVNRYFGCQYQSKTKDVAVLVTDDKSACECDGIVISASDVTGKSEEKIYELLCDTADKNTGARIVVNVPLNTDTSFISGVRAVYRASVWGVFSLLCARIYTPDSAKRCVSLIHSAFRELDTEKREFNGFIPKGILVETPLMLLEEPNHRLFDHFCLDLASLSSLFCKQTDCSVSKISRYIKSFIKSAGSAAVSVDVKNITQLEELSELFNNGNIRDVYARRELVANIRNLL